MKKFILLIITLITSHSLFAQETTLGNFPGAYRYKNRLYIDSLLLLPIQDAATPVPLRDGAMRYNPTLGYIQLWQTGAWSNIISDVGITASNGLTKVGTDIQLGGIYGDDAVSRIILGHNGTNLRLQNTSATNYNTDPNTTEIRQAATFLSLQSLNRTAGGNTTLSISSTTGALTNTTVGSSIISTNGDNTSQLVIPTNSSSLTLSTNTTSSGLGSSIGITSPSIQVVSPSIGLQGILQSNNLLNNLSEDSVLSTDNMGIFKQKALNVGAVAGLQDSLNARWDSTTTISKINASTVTAANGLTKTANIIKLGGSLTEPTYITTNFQNIRFLNNRPSFMEFARTGAPSTWDSAVGSVGAFGNPEMNVGFNMDYTDAVHRLYDKTQGAEWLALGGEAGAIQYTHSYFGTGDAWSASGAGYVMSWNTSSGDSKIGFNTNSPIPVGDGNVMIKRTASQASLTGYTDLALSGHRDKGTAGIIYLAPYDTGRIIAAFGGGKVSVGTGNTGDGTMMIGRTGVNPNLTGDNFMIIEGHRIKGVPAEVYLNAYNTGTVRLNDGGGATVINAFGQVAGDAKLSVFRPAAGVSISGNTDLVIEGNKTKGTAGIVYVNNYNNASVYLASGGGNVSIGGLTGTDKLNVLGNQSITGGQLTLSSAGSNNISFSASGIGPPTFTTVSAGEKLKCYNTLSGSQANYGIGVEINNLWLGVPTTTSGFNFYGGTTKMFTIQSTGIGIGVSTPAALIHVAGTGELSRWAYDATNYLSLSGSSTSNNTFTASGSSPQISFASFTNMNGGLKITNGILGVGKVWTDTAGNGAGSWRTPAAGTVTSVALSLPSIFTVSGSPVTSSGTLTGSLAPQAANTVFAGPTAGGAVAPAFRALVAADLPALPIPTLEQVTASTNGNNTKQLIQIKGAAGAVLPGYAMELYTDSVSVTKSGYITAINRPTGVPVELRLQYLAGTYASPALTRIGGAGADVTILGGNAVDSARTNFINSGSNASAITTITNSTLLTNVHSSVLCNNSSDIVVTLPTASSCTGRTYRIKKISNNANTITINAATGVTIDGSATVIILTLNQSLDIQSNGTSWFVF